MLLKWSVRPRVRAAYSVFLVQAFYATRRYDCLLVYPASFLLRVLSSHIISVRQLSALQTSTTKRKNNWTSFLVAFSFSPTRLVMSVASIKRPLFNYNKPPFYGSAKSYDIRPVRACCHSARSHNVYMDFMLSE